MIRKLVLAAAVVAGSFGFASKADAQVFYSGGYYYNTPGVYSSYYIAPSYYSMNSIYPASFYSPPYNAGWYWSGYNYQRSLPYYSGYRNYYRPYSSYYGRRGWRW